MEHGQINTEMEQQTGILFAQGDMVACYGTMVYRLAYAYGIFR